MTLITELKIARNPSHLSTTLILIITTGAVSGIYDFQSRELSIDNLFPNPAQDRITLAINNQIETYQVPIQVFDSFGQKIFDKAVFLEKGVNAFAINTSKFNEGVYLVVLPNGRQQNLVKRFIITK